MKRLILYLGIVLIRLVAIFLIFAINPLLAILIVIILDHFDGGIFRLYLGISTKSKKYQFTDKILDIIYYFALLILSIQLSLPTLPILAILLIYRLIGEAVYFVTSKEFIFLIFPNFYEFTVIFSLIVNSVRPELLDPKFNVIILPLLFIGMIVITAEYFIHIYEGTAEELFWRPLLSKFGIHLKK